MSGKQNRPQDSYSSARDAFDELKIEDKALFLIEATVSTIGRGLEDAGRALTHLFEDLVRGGHGEDTAPSEAAPSEAAPTTPKKAPKKTPRQTTRTRKKNDAPDAS